ncbi:right-handed parallel beta-helix repeat-containing protein [Paenibacillus qinlingensis]|uniref:F5/8 type C domain-containing protein n=1 Tax=Paenibacillus qinlingensis TaxID=1837343 RepID=A0ABU1NVM2_9BACL|nr:right-handed parallel beta-helix repeat-containing protein [Paenibacillus qinlingensis]MDR6551042.1 hypothetical protein [Paenibacillus qinlingensis]
MMIQFQFHQAWRRFLSFMLIVALSVGLSGLSPSTVLAADAILSQGKAVTVSSTQTGNPGSNANDGDTATRWASSSGTMPQWWQVDLGEMRALTKVSSQWYLGASRSYKYKIEVSPDNVTFTTVVDKTSNTTLGDTNDNFLDVGRYVRITVTGSSVANAFASANEIQVYGKPNVNITSYGAVATSGTDNTTAINNAITAAKASGSAVYVPSGRFEHAGLIQLDGVVMYGSGQSSILAATNQTNQAVRMTNTNAVLTDLKLTAVTSTRSAANTTCGIYVEGAVTGGTSNIGYFLIERVTVDGANGAGIMIKGASNGLVQNNTVTNTLADGIHTTAGSYNIRIHNNNVSNTGDDGIAVVSYQLKDPQAVHDVWITNNQFSNQPTAGRGMTVIGGNNVTIQNNTITNPLNAGILIASESAYSTFGVNNVTVDNNTITNGGSTTTSHGALMVSSSFNNVSNVTFSNNKLYNSRKMGINVTGDHVQSVTFSNNTITSTSPSVSSTSTEGALIDSSFVGTATFTGNTFVRTATNGLKWKNGMTAGTLNVQGNTFQDINTSNTAANDVIKLETGTVTSVKIQNNTHTNPAGYAINYFLEELVNGSTQTYSGNSSPLQSYINGAAVPTP